ncbi:MAG: ROK family protein [Pseudomonadota bacterium]
MAACLGLDLGGTSVKALLAEGPDAIHARFTVPTTAPGEIVAALAAEIENLTPRPAALGVASFGPLDRDPAAPTYGRILDTPKPGWSGADVLAALAPLVDGPAVIDTDVNGALTGETAWGAARGLSDAVYVTIGTGVGGGVLSGGRLVGQPSHPEIGHLMLRRLPEERAVFPGVCPFHGDCAEGVLSAPALQARWGAPPDSLPDDHPAWPVAGHDLAQLCLALTYAYRPQRIILGGGVMARAGLIERARAAFADLAAGYALPPAAADLSAYIAPPALGPDAGALGAVRLAQAALHAPAAPA